MRPASGCPRGSQTRCAASAPCTTCTPQVAGAAPAARGARARRARRAVHHRRAHRASDRAARPARRGLPPAALRAGQRRTLADRFAAAVRVPLGHGGPRPAHSNPALVTLTLPSSLQPHTRPAHPTISALQPHAPCTLAMHPRLTHALTHARTHAHAHARASPHATPSSRDVTARCAGQQPHRPRVGRHGVHARRVRAARRADGLRHAEPRCRTRGMHEAERSAPALPRQGREKAALRPRCTVCLTGSEHPGMAGGAA